MKFLLNDRVRFTNSKVLKDALKNQEGTVVFIEDDRILVQCDNEVNINVLPLPYPKYPKNKCVWVSSCVLDELRLTFRPCHPVFIGCRVFFRNKMADDGITNIEGTVVSFNVTRPAFYVEYKEGFSTCEEFIDFDCESSCIGILLDYKKVSRFKKEDIVISNQNEILMITSDDITMRKGEVCVDTKRLYPGCKLGVRSEVSLTPISDYDIVFNKKPEPSRKWTDEEILYCKTYVAESLLRFQDSPEVSYCVKTYPKKTGKNYDPADKSTIYAPGVMFTYIRSQKGGDYKTSSICSMPSDKFEFNEFIGMACSIAYFFNEREKLAKILGSNIPANA